MTRSPERMRDGGGSEARRLLRLAGPVVLGQLAFMMLGFVDALMVGHLSVEALAAASIANVWVFGTMMFANGFLMGLDPLVSQAHGAGDGERCALALQRGVLATALALPLALLWSFTEEILGLFGQDPSLAAAAGDYARVQRPSAPFLLWSIALRQYLQGREIVKPAMWVTLAANVWNALLNWALIFGALGAPALGLRGAGISTAITRVLSFVALLAVIRLLALHRGAWLPWSRRALEPAGLALLASIGLPVAVQVSLEMWAFSGSALIVGHLGATPLAAHSIVMNLASITFMVPLGISIGAGIRVGNLLGARRPADAQRTAWLALAMGAGVMAVSALGFVALREWLPRLYSEDAAVRLLATSILPIAAAFQIFDGTQAVACGVLRGMGRTRPAAVFNLIGYWVLALPIGGWLALGSGAGVHGIWWGLCGGLAVVALCLTAWIAARGPATATALAHP